MDIKPSNPFSAEGVKAPLPLSAKGKRNSVKFAIVFATKYFIYVHTVCLNWYMVVSNKNNMYLWTILCSYSASEKIRITFLFLRINFPFYFVLAVCFLLWIVTPTVCDHANSKNERRKFNSTIRFIFNLQRKINSQGLYNMNMNTGIMYKGHNVLSIAWRHSWALGV